jgi:hypothetical protein
MIIEGFRDQRDACSWFHSAIASSVGQPDGTAQQPLTEIYCDFMVIMLIGGPLGVADPVPLLTPRLGSGR